MAANNNTPPVLNPGVWHDDEPERPSSVVSSGSFTGQPEYRDSSYLGPHGDGPAPSIISRDSTYGSLAAPSIAGSASGIRSSWGSSNALAAHEQGPAGFDVSSSVPPPLRHQIAPSSRPPWEVHRPPPHLGATCNWRSASCISLPASVAVAVSTPPPKHPPCALRNTN